MSNRLELVSDDSVGQAQETVRPAPVSAVSSSAVSSFSPRSAATLWPVVLLKRFTAAFRAVIRDERGAVTAEYAIVIMAGVAFAGILVAIVRSDAIRTILVGLVENALGTGN